MTITQNQLINLFNQPINPNTYLTYTDILLSPNLQKVGEEDIEEYLKNLYQFFQTQTTLLLISGETGEIVNEIPLQNYNNQHFSNVPNNNFTISTF